MRKTGFYFVKQDLDIGWECAYWSGEIWLIVGNTYHFKDNNFLEIDEHQIIRRDISSDPNYKLTIIDGSEVPELKNLTNPE